MSLLLDTHAFLWYVLDDPQLSPLASYSIGITDPAAGKPAPRVFISPASYWEIAIKISLGKYELKVPYQEFWRRGIEANGFEILPIELKHTAILTELPFHHRDPFDRLIIAQAISESIPLVSRDAHFDQYSVKRLW